jgi:hypothetical protein
VRGGIPLDDARGDRRRQERRLALRFERDEEEREGRGDLTAEVLEMHRDRAGQVGVGLPALRRFGQDQQRHARAPMPARDLQQVW